MIFLPVTLSAAGAAALLNFWLGARIIRIRLSNKILHGEGAQGELTTRMRAHLNFTEYAPLTLILIALIELATGSSIYLWGLAAAFLLGRALHAIGMVGPIWARQAGMLLTFVPMLLLASYAIYLGAQPQPAPTAVFKIGPKG
ncbi:MAPEG family protein [Sphingomonas sp. HITSZ_GF]|uniref:MAPEG family protein n=1 Tax=Sphingomonas sp. HITSZ_GF TaxID=3037247 RepID=UPI00240DCF85|nr:MAPEG family protein [Sphingomonas sp. HITSZ_GF]MDG2533674.1 MAPEG family protein [Sphingomonas sp. HITSZ_GF]